MKIYYKDSCGTYSIEEHYGGTATLRCRNNSNGNLDVEKTYNSAKGARTALARYCGGMPAENGREEQ